MNMIENHWESFKNQWKPMQIIDILWIPLKIIEIQWEPLKIIENHLEQ